MVDVLSSANVSPPRLPFSSDFERKRRPGSPLTLPNSHLLVSTVISPFDWPVGSDSWSELQISDAQIE